MNYHCPLFRAVVVHGQYAGELHIARKNMKNTGKTSVVGKIDPNYMGLLDSIKPWQKFKLKIKK